MLNIQLKGVLFPDTLYNVTTCQNIIIGNIPYAKLKRREIFQYCEFTKFKTRCRNPKFKTRYDVFGPCEIKSPRTFRLLLYVVFVPKVKYVG